MTRADDLPGSEDLQSIAFVFGTGLALLIALLVIHLQQGATDIGVRTILEGLLTSRDTTRHVIVRFLRLPRAVAGLLSGAMLAVAGLLLQTSTRNPLAAPATLGVNAGAFLAVVAGAALVPGLENAFPLGVAFVGGLGAAALAITVAGGLSATSVRLALAGMAVAMAFSAGSTALQVLFEQETAGLFFWGSGSLLQDGWDLIRFTSWRGLPAIGVALLMSRSLDVFGLGDDTARGLGQRVDLVRLGSTGVAVFLAASAVNLTGPIGFVGLVAPHLVRLMGLRRHLWRMLGAIVWGPVIVVGADIAGRWISPGVAEIPAGLVTALIGAPFLIYLARRVGTRKERTPKAGDRRVQGPATRRRIPFGGTVLLASTALVAVGVSGLALGAVDLSVYEVLAAVRGTGAATAREIVVGIRMPRVVVAGLAGGALATSGLLLQGVVRNPLAAPDLVGVMSGASVGAIVLMLVLPDAPIALIPVAAFAGAVLAFAVVYVVAWRDGVSAERLALVGIGVAALGTSIVHLLVVQSDMRIARALVWLSGSTYAQNWGDVVGLGAWFVALVPAAWLFAGQLDLLGMGDEAAQGRGLDVERSRLLQLGLAVALAAAAVAVVGTMSFIGLVAPHAARLLVGGRHRRLVPVAVLLGALLLVAADLIGRVVLAPAQLPSGLVAALLGAPYFVWLLRRTSRPG